MTTAKKVTVYHNPVCGKSRGALEILAERGIESEVIEYLKSPLDRATLERLPRPAARRSRRAGAQGQALQGARPERGATTSPATRSFALLLEHPELMERPVVIHGGRAIIARPSERVLEILD